MEQFQKITVTATPHITDDVTTKEIMRDVLIALLPATIMGIYYFGMNAALTIIICMASSVLFEYGYQKLMKKTITIGDLSAAVTGLLLALNLPANGNFALGIVGSFFAIIVVKQLFGGIGQNFVNPALAGRAFLLISYPSGMVEFPPPTRNLFSLGTDAITSATVDAVSAPTPLHNFSQGTMPLNTDYINRLIGYTKGSIGEVCAIAIIIGGLYLVIRKVISLYIPLSYILSYILLSYLLGVFGVADSVPLYEILLGGLLFGAFFMATDYTTSPITKEGKILYGIGCGIITLIIRKFGAYPEGVSFAILLMNLLTPLIDHFIKPRVFGTKRGGRKNGKV